MIGPDKGLLAETKILIEKLNLSNFVEITGKVANSELWKYYTSHSIYLNTTNTESFGVAVMEAASCGIPIVTTSVGELSYLWQNEENAMLVDSFNENDFAEKVIQVFEDKNLILKLKSNARAKAESFDWENVKSQWFSLLS
jgi:glycosyltransferase involved in cell wall biosynthesis